jgi:hypothetical protein
MTAPPSTPIRVPSVEDFKFDFEPILIILARGEVALETACIGEFASMRAAQAGGMSARSSA